MSLQLTPFTVLVGENSSGKSTVLQALDFLCSVATRDIDAYLKDREWDFSDIKSQFASSSDNISFITHFEIDDKQLLWEISINSTFGKWSILEKITDVDTKECYLSFGQKEPDIPYNFSQLNIESSALKTLDINIEDYKGSKYSPILFKLKSLLMSSCSFELLSPDKMRSKGSRGKVNDIGLGGERLAAFIHGMPPQKRNELNKALSEFIGYDVKISTTTKGQPGWVEMYLVESWADNEIKVKKRYISDGLLRIIAFLAILVNQDRKKPALDDFATKGVMMLDEIEDGIHPFHSEKLVERFKKVTKETKQQIVITSHSPVILNFIDEDDIVLMWRDQDGEIRAKPLFETIAMKETLDILNPGEVWLNYPKDSIIEMLLSQQEDKYD